MKRLLPLIALLISSCDPAATSPNLASYVRYETVTRIKDGDTFEIAANWSPYKLVWSVRILGVDAPETGGKAHCPQERILADQAEAMTKSLIEKSGGRVRLTHVQHDKFGGRIDADVFTRDGRSIADELLKAGLAKPFDGEGHKPNWCA